MIPAIVDCVLLMVQTLLGPDCLPPLILAAQELLMGIVEGLILATPDILESIPPLVESIIQSFAELGPQLVDNAFSWGYDMIESLVSGINDALPLLASGAMGAAGTIAAYLHHTTPEKGPLKDDDQWGSDFIDNFITGMNSEDAALERALIQQGNVIYNGMSQDYSGQLAGIASALNSIGSAGGGMPSVINLYMGTTRVGSVVVDAMNTEYYLSGGN